MLASGQTFNKFVIDNLSNNVVHRKIAIYSEHFIGCVSCFQRDNSFVNAVTPDRGRNPKRQLTSDRGARPLELLPKLTL